MMVNTLVIFLFILFTGCAKSTYLVKQGVGQWSLLSQAQSNEKLLKSDKYKPEVKRKIRLVQAYSRYFEDYFSHSVGGIYKKTTLLDREAASYLVVVSSHDKIEAISIQFPFYGNFPYLGFFSLDDAKSYAQGWQDKGFITYIRPVYAYSTLGTFSDPILSSFFVYDDEQLAELVFHELFHSLFFIKDEVELNENLANFFARELTIRYFGSVDSMREQKAQKKQFEHSFHQRTHQFIKTLNHRYQSEKKLSQQKAQEILEQYKAGFLEDVRAICDQHNKKGESCYPLYKKWNQASLAGFKTYSNLAQSIEQMYRKNDFTPLQFYEYLNRKYQQFKKQGTSKESFWAYLKGNL